MRGKAKRKIGIKWTLGSVLLVSIIVVSAYGYRGYRMMQRRKAMNADWLPKFKEPNTKYPFAKQSNAFTVRVGFSTPQEIQKLTQKEGLSCKDTSIRAMMKTWRMKKQAEAEKKKAKGVDVVSNASSYRKSPRERIPTFRWSCQNTSLDFLQDYKRPNTPKGRWLFVFDSLKHPLRNVSYQYDSYHPAAIRHLKKMIVHYTKMYGKPTSKKGKPLPEITENTPKNAVLLKKYDKFVFQWTFADLEVLIQARSYGSWMNVMEQVSVPWPIRPDAPAKHTAVATSK